MASGCVVRDLQETLLRNGAADRRGFNATSPKVIANLVSRDYPQPSAERVARLVPVEAKDGFGHRPKDLLQDIRSVFRTQPRTSAPTVDHGAVQVKQPLPPLGVAGLDPLNQARRRRLASDRTHSISPVCHDSERL
jgi:hypothetical protein